MHIVGKVAWIGITMVALGGLVVKGIEAYGSAASSEGRNRSRRQPPSSPSPQRRSSSLCLNPPCGRSRTHTKNNRCLTGAAA